MTWRACIIGLLAVVLISVIAPHNDLRVRATFITGNHFPAGAVCILLALTLGINVLVKLVRRAWALRQSELMLVWCMLIVASTVPASGLMRYWFSMLAAPAYYAARPDKTYEDNVLKEVPAELVLTKDPRSVAARQFFEGRGTGERVRTFMELWARPLAIWGVFILLFYLATFFLTGLLRRQWVEVERLIFPLARVPLELTEGSEQPHLFPPLVRNTAFLVGAIITAVFAFIRMAPVLLFGKETGWAPVFPIQNVLWGTPIAELRIGAAYFFPMAVGLAFLVPADVALSIWLFFLFTRCELLVAYWMGTPLKGYTYGPFMAWQQAGAFIVFSLMMFWMARRHLLAVLHKALWVGASGESQKRIRLGTMACQLLPGAAAVALAYALLGLNAKLALVLLGVLVCVALAQAAWALLGRPQKEADDSQEPISFRVCFWGLVWAVGAMVGWYVYFGMYPAAAVAVIGLLFCLALTHARLVAQGGVFFVQQTWHVPQLLHDLSGGRAFSSAGAVVAQMQHAILAADAREILSGHAVNALRISSVFERGRRWFLPLMMVSLVVAMVVCTAFTLRVYYDMGGMSVGDVYGTQSLPLATFDLAQRMITNPAGSVDPHYWALAAGAGIMLFLTLMRMYFYWWPVHSLGFLIGSTWPAQNLWFPFLLGWLTKVLILKYGGGGLLKSARNFFLGVIIAEALAIGASTVLGLMQIKLGNLFMPV